MNRLVLTLVVVALAAIVMATWGFERLFQETQQSNTQIEQLHERRLGQSLALLLENESDPYGALTQHQAAGLPLSIQALSELNLPPLLQNTLIADKFLTLQSANEISYLYPIKNNSLALIINRPLINSSNFSLQIVFTLLFYACIAAVLLLWSKPLINRLIKLRQTTRAFGEGDLQQRIKEGSSLYIGDIEKEFNRMADRVETLVADNKLLSTAVSHDLKTPLARLRFGVDVLQEASNEQQREKYLSKISRDLQEMEALVETLLCYARLDQAKLELHKDNIDLIQFINELTSTAEFGNLIIEWNPPTEAVYVEGDKRYLSLMINNLVSNACQHARQSVAITVDRTGTAVKLLVEDDGPGIPSTQRHAILKPFVRGEQERSTPGHGMGLAIVNRIIHWHRWGLAIGDSKSLGGAQVEVTIS